MMIELHPTLMSTAMELYLHARIRLYCAMLMHKGNVNFKDIIQINHGEQKIKAGLKL